MKITILLAILCVFGTLLNFPAFVPTLLHNQPWTIFTSIFAHAGVKHLIYNLIGLFLFGVILEKIIGWKWYSILILISIGFSTVGYTLLSNPYIGAIGISGVVFGLIGALALLRPKMIVYTPFGPLPMVVAAGAWAILEFLMLGATDSIAHSAHLFGLIGGISFSALFKLNKKFVPVLFLIFPIIFLLPVPSFPTYATNCNLTYSYSNYHFSYSEYRCNNFTEIGIYIPYSHEDLYQLIDNGKSILSQIGDYEISRIFNDGNKISIEGEINGSNFVMRIEPHKYAVLYLIDIY